MTMTPEHWHLALNHLPILGMPIGAAVAAWGVIRRNREISNLGLVVILFCALGMPWIMATGDDAQLNYEGAEFVDSDGYAWMTEHAERAANAAWAAYIAGATGMLALLASIRNPKTYRVLSSLTIFATLATVALAVHTADAGGKIRRPDFRETATTDTSDETL